MYGASVFKIIPVHPKSLFKLFEQICQRRIVYTLHSELMANTRIHLTWKRVPLFIDQYIGINSENNCVPGFWRA